MQVLEPQKNNKKKAKDKKKKKENKKNRHKKRHKKKREEVTRTEPACDGAANMYVLQCASL